MSGLTSLLIVLAIGDVSDELGITSVAEVA